MKTKFILLLPLLFCGCLNESEITEIPSTIQSQNLHLKESNYCIGIIKRPKYWNNPESLILVADIDHNRVLFVQDIGKIVK